MISSIIDAVLIAALVVTSGCVILMYRRLKQFDALQGEAASAFASASKALEQARLALHNLQSEGDVMAVALASRLNEARSMLNELDTTLMHHAARGAMASPAPAAPPAPAPAVVIKAPAATEPHTLHVHKVDANAQGDGSASAMPWTPPAAKIRAAVSNNMARSRAAAAATPDETWSELTPVAGVPTAH